MTIEQAILTTKALGALRVESANGTEGVNELPSWTVTVLADDPSLDLDAALGGDAVLDIGDEHGAMRRIPLMVRSASYAGETKTGHRYELELTATVALLQERSGYRVFLGKSVRAIVDEVLENAGIPSAGVVWRLAEPLTEREQCVMYGEIEWAFVERLLADEGVSYWFETGEDDKAVLVLGDGPGSHSPADGDPFGLDDGSGLRGKGPAFFRFERTSRVTEEAVHVRDYDIRHPDVLVEGRAGSSFYERYEYPAWLVGADRAERRAKRRLEALQRHRETATSETHSVALVAGRVLTVSGIPDEGFDGDYLVARVGHQISQAGRHTAGAKPYRAKALLVAHDGKRAHRPAPPERVPRVDGVETAFVTGPKGEEIHVDDLGRIKVALPWDPSGKSDDTSSTWVRTLQWNMGGAMILPRIGMEMALGYRDGRPDMPLALGRTYNGRSKPPYGLPGKKATASLMSGTSPGGRSVNEIRLTDDAGSQQFGVQASGDQGVVVGGNQTTTIAGNEGRGVKANLTEHVKGSQSVSVGANQTLTADAAAETKVDGARVVTVGGSESIGVTASRVLECSSATELTGGLYFLRCNVAAETCKATYFGLVGGALGIAAGAGTAESVLGARTEACGGPRLIAAYHMDDKCYGAKAITAGAHVLAAGGPLATKVTTAAAIQAASARISAGSGLVIQAASVTITAASLTVSGGTTYKIAGSHSASADVNLDNSTASFKASTNAGD